MSDSRPHEERPRRRQLDVELRHSAQRHAAREERTSDSLTYYGKR